MVCLLIEKNTSIKHPSIHEIVNTSTTMPTKAIDFEAVPKSRCGGCHRGGVVEPSSAVSCVVVVRADGGKHRAGGEEGLDHSSSLCALAEH